MQGWVKLHRSLKGSAIASHPEYLAVWVHLLMRASHKPREAVVGRSIVSLKAGDVVFGRKKFSAETGVSENKVRAALDVLKRLNQITIKSHAKFSLISITKWSEYQDESPPNNQHSASNAPAPSQHPATDKNVENGENDKKQPPKNKFSDEDLECAKWLFEKLREFIPDCKQPNLKGWADHVRKMRELDNRDLKEICHVWLWCRKDDFEAANVQSPEKLRKRYDQLKTKMRMPHGVNQPNRKESLAERSYREAEEIHADIAAREAGERAMGEDEAVIRPQVGQSGWPRETG